MPFLAKGIEPYIKWIKENVNRELLNKKKEQRKKVYVSFIVDDDGNTSGFEVEKGLGDPYDKEALRLIMNNPQTWVPGQCGKKKVKTRMTMPVAF
jgi:hypothetical protein